jgi:catechol 2,3-dioxygenase-like lactoylglutathione lyase family enzyme
MLGAANVIAFLPSIHLERSRRFYADSLGLTVEELTPYACVVRAGQTMIRITKVDELRPQPFTVLGWEVTDIRREVDELTVRGVEFTRYDGVDQDAAGIWLAPGGDAIAWFRDPDGNTLSLTQFASR